MMVSFPNVHGRWEVNVMRWIKYVWEMIQVWFCRYFGRTYRCGCGHTAKRKTVLIIDGEVGFYTVSDTHSEWCPECFSGAVIRCAWCDQVILPGEPVTLYSPGPVRGFFSSEEPTEVHLRRRQENFVIPEHAVVYKKKPRLQLVGCLRRGCADGPDRAGFWKMPGKVQRVMTIEEMLIAQGGGVVGCSNLYDPEQAIPVADDE